MSLNKVDVRDEHTTKIHAKAREKLRKPCTRRSRPIILDISGNMLIQVRRSIDHQRMIELCNTASSLEPVPLTNSTQEGVDQAAKLDHTVKAPGSRLSSNRETYVKAGAAKMTPRAFSRQPTS
jgi:hypothetical protein